jgi:hypothetical protein
VNAQFQAAWRLAFCRAPSAGEIEAGTAFLREQAAALAADSAPEPPAATTSPAHAALSNLCHALVISNGFLYVD